MASKWWRGRAAASITPQMGMATSTKAMSVTPSAGVLRSISLRPEASRTNTSAGRIKVSRAREETFAPMYTPGMLPTRIEPVMAKTKSPNRMCPRAAAVTSVMAWTRSVPTSSRVVSIG